MSDLDFKPEKKGKHYTCYSFLHNKHCGEKHKTLSAAKKHCPEVDKLYFYKDLAAMSKNIGQKTNGVARRR